MGQGPMRGLKFWPRIEELPNLNDLWPVGIILMVDQTWSHLRRPSFGVAECVNGKPVYVMKNPSLIDILCLLTLEDPTWMLPLSFG